MRCVVRGLLRGDAGAVFELEEAVGVAVGVDELKVFVGGDVGAREQSYAGTEDDGRDEDYDLVQ